VTKKKLKRNAVVTGKIRNGAVTGPKLANDAVTGERIASDAVGSDELANGSVGSNELSDGSVDVAKLASDAQPRVVAFGHVVDPLGITDPSLAQSFGLTGVEEGGAGANGWTFVEVSPEAIPGPADDVTACTILATIATEGEPNSSLGYPGFVVIGVDGGLASNVIQVQTRNDTAGLEDREYYIQVTCPPA
jgi:hypothetical protein